MPSAPPAGGGSDVGLNPASSPGRSPPSSRGGGAGGLGNEGAVAHMMRMGYTKDQAAQALLKSGGDVEEAVSLLSDYGR